MRPDAQQFGRRANTSTISHGSSSSCPTALLTTTISDAHTWNLVFLQRWLEESGLAVRNLGPCPPVGLVIAEATNVVPDLIVVSTVNGHGVNDGLQLIRALRAVPSLRAIRVVIGGKLGIGLGGRRYRERLLSEGFSAVLDGEDGMSRLQTLLATLVVRGGK
ncbi:methylmalonyl-CoA mutase [Amycolatopsis sp. DG1A-15b]|uniref:methylmalonyl-CoA mutase n=1 Tax=Amycolatopsis sp. DG1A-15b TaxID=3052846 RepID=UPI00255BB7F0|nr:methylmalonyl-CoA mutase [Amycolatopsis sp. DG1A-15b]WIX92956.1 methylmalonyl-CoA mutase [Amycolatopsis sp. DG1A-15b]